MTKRTKKTERPIGTVENINRDGTIQIRLDLSSPDACAIMEAFFRGGNEAANAKLRELQKRKAKR